jgi:hypothetical protein
MKVKTSPSDSDYARKKLLKKVKKFHVLSRRIVSMEGQRLLLMQALHGGLRIYVLKF